MNISQTLADAKDMLSRARDEARTTGVAAIEAMLAKVRELMSDDGKLYPFLGMPNLMTSSAPYRGMLVRSQRQDRGLPYGRDHDGAGPAVLVLNNTCQLVYARRMPGSIAQEIEVDLADLRAEDAEHVAETLALAITSHLACAKGKERNYRDLERLASRLQNALENEEEPDHG